MRKKKKYDDDDGRVIAPMNVAGMPWYIEKTDNCLTESSGTAKNDESKLSKKDTARLIFKLYSIMIPIALVFIIGLVLLIIFVGKPWK